ncbi:MAG: hypothetical protein GY947_05270 [Rhodobacteraceae bacterium]|nr:hypothetical protein [Paracoccaceae bacterium]
MIALKIQEFKSAQKLQGNQPLLKINNREEEVKAPYQFDPAKGRIHRTGCRSIPESSNSALYSLWEFGAQDQELACPQCKPAPEETKRDNPHIAMDLFYGLLSVADQFSGVIRERGREFRNSSEGQRMSADLEGMYQEFGDRERQVMDTVLSSLDGIAKIVGDIEAGLNDQNDREENPPDA